MSRTSRRRPFTQGRMVATAGIAALVLTGCGSTTLHTGAAAVVGADRITTGTLETVVTRSLKDPSAAQTAGANRPAFERSVLGRLIEHLVVTNAAAREGVTVSGGDIDNAMDRIATQIGGPDKLKAAALKAGIAPADLRQTVSDVALRDKLSDELTKDVDVPEASLRAAYKQGIAQFDQVHSAHILVASKPLAEKILAQVKADPSTFAALAAQYSTDTGSKAKGGDIGFQGRGALDKVFEAAIFDSPAGSYVIAKSQFGFHVIHVIEHRITTFEQAREELRRGLLGQQRGDAVAKLLRATAKRLGVHVNPRFGVWDATALDVAAPKADPKKDVSKASPRPGAAEATPPAAPAP